MPKQWPNLWIKCQVWFSTFSVFQENQHMTLSCLRDKLNKFICHFPAHNSLIHNKSKIINTFYLFVGYALRMFFQNHTYMHIPTLLTVHGQINYDNWFYWLIWGFRAQSTVLRACRAHQWNIFTLLLCWLKISYMPGWSIQNAHTFIDLTNSLQ